MSPASRRLRRLRPRLAGAAFLVASLAGAAGASPPAAVPRPNPGPASPFCPATSIDDLLEGDGIDLGRRGFELRRLGGAYVLEFFHAYSAGACGERGEIVDRALAAVTSWRHRARGDRTEVSQVQAAEPTANLLEEGWASFWWQGYAFQVVVEGACPPPPPGGLAGRSAAEPPAFDLRARTGPPLPAERRAPGPPGVLPKSPPYPCDAPAAEVLAQAIAELAPGLDLACFHRRRTGAWDDLGELGLGDPRDALPAGWAEAHFQLSYLEPPAASCGGPTPEIGAAVSFSASFSGPDDSWAGASAYSLPPGSAPGPGYIDDYSAYWANGSYQYSVASWSAGGAAGDPGLVRALAAALDPGFPHACLVESRQLAPAEAVALGFHLAEAPAGFEEVDSQLTAQLPSAACDDAVAPVYSFSWSFSDGADLAILASLYHPGAGGGGGSGGGGVAPPDGGPIEGYLVWTDAAGTSYEVYGYSVSGGPGPASELLVEVARSMDPTYGGP